MIIDYKELTPELARKGCFVLNMPNEDYHAYEGISKSGLDKINRSPAHFMFDAKKPSKRHLELGTALHTAVLEPERFNKEYLIVKGINDKRNSEWKEAAKNIDSSLLLTDSEGANIISIQEAIRSNQQASNALLTCNLFEVSAFIEINGVLCRCRYDALNIEFGCSIDLKTTQCSEREEFAKSVFNYRYHVQHAFYSRIFELITGEPLVFEFLAVENEPPHCPMVYQLDAEAVEIGLAEALKDLEAYRLANATQDWIGYEQTNEPLSLPIWALAKYESKLDEDIV